MRVGEGVVDIGLFNFKEPAWIAKRLNRVLLTDSIPIYPDSDRQPKKHAVNVTNVRNGVLFFDVRHLNPVNKAIRGFTCHTIYVTFDSRSGGKLNDFSLPSVFLPELYACNCLMNISEAAAERHKQKMPTETQEARIATLNLYTEALMRETTEAVRSYMTHMTGKAYAATGGAAVVSKYDYLRALQVLNTTGITPGIPIQNSGTASKLEASARIIRYMGSYEEPNPNDPQSYDNITASPGWVKYLPTKKNMARYEQHYLVTLDAAESAAGSPIIWFVFSLHKGDDETKSVMMLHGWSQSFLGIAMRSVLPEKQQRVGRTAAFALSYLCSEIATHLLGGDRIAAVYMEALEGTEVVLKGMREYWESQKKSKYCGPVLVKPSEKIREDGMYYDIKLRADKLIVDRWVTDYWTRFIEEEEEEHDQSKRPRTERCISCGISGAVFAPNGNPELGVYCGEHCYHHNE
jgi:hypothetical protein